MAGVCVTAQPARGPAQPAGQAAVTARAGMFTISGLAPGAYRLAYHLCAAPGAGITWPGTAALSPAALLVPATPSLGFVTGGQFTRLAPVTVRAAASAASQAMPAMPAASAMRTVRPAPRPAVAARLGGISGTVLGPHGRHLRGLCFELVQHGGAQGMDLGPRGHYNSGKIFEPGRYLVQFTPQCGFEGAGSASGNWAPQWYRAAYFQSAAKPVVIRAGKITKGISAVMRPGATVSGTVTGSSGHGAAGVCVVIVSPKGTGLGQFRTGASGRYRFRGLDPGRYRIGYFPGCGDSDPDLPQWWPGTPDETKSGLIKLGFGEHRTGIDARLVLGGSISGVIRFKSRKGHPIKGMCIVVQPPGQVFTAFFASTGPKGTYLIRGLPAGHYSVNFGPGCGNNGNYLSQNYPHGVSVRLGHLTAHVNASLQPGAIITGTVRDKSSGKALPGICVSVDSGLILAESNRNGSYSANQIPPGKSDVAFFNCRSHGNFAPQSYDGQLNGAAARRVSFRAGKVTAGIDAAMTPGATISGTLSLASGKTSGEKLNGVCADAVPAGQVRSFGTQAVEFDGFFGQSSHGGGYSIENLPAGQYQVSFGTCGGPNVADQWYTSQRGPDAADRINVPAGGVVSPINGDLRPAGIITGLLRGPASQQGTFVCLNVTSTSTGLESFEQPLTLVGSDYAVGGLAPGSYLVEFDPCGGENLAMQWFDRAATPAGARPVRVLAGHQTGSVNAWLTTGGEITGRVVSKASGHPVAGVCAFASGISEPFFGFTSIGPKGNYRIGGLNSGTYRITFEACGAADLLPLISSRVHATAGRTVAGPRVAIASYRPGAISGRVRGDSPVPAAAPGVCLDAIPLAPGAVRGFGQFGTAGFNGYYKLARLVPGRYKLFFGDPACGTDPGDLVPQWYDGKPSASAATVVTVRPGRTTRPISVLLRPDGWIAGTVTGSAPAGKALGGICVRAVPVAGTAAPFLAISGKADGHYLIGPLAPGRYRVEFVANCGVTGFATQWWAGVTSSGKATPVWVRAGRTHTGINAAMVPKS